MDIKAIKLELMQLIMHTEKESVLQKLQQVFEEESADWWDDLSQEEKKEIDIGIEQAENGKFIDNTQVQLFFKKWH